MSHEVLGSEKKFDDADLKVVECVYYISGDRIDCMNEEYGAWFEAVVLNVYRYNNKLLYLVEWENKLDFESFYVLEKLVRPRLQNNILPQDLELGQTVVVNTNLYNYGELGFWYDYKVENIIRQDNEITHLLGTLYIGVNGNNIKNYAIGLKYPIFAIEKPVLIKERQKSIDFPICPSYGVGNHTHYCLYCVFISDSFCTICGCKICHIKTNCSSFIFCSGCDHKYHIECLQLSDSQISNSWKCYECLSRKHNYCNGFRKGYPLIGHKTKQKSKLDFKKKKKNRKSKRVMNYKSKDSEIEDKIKGFKNRNTGGKYRSRYVKEEISADQEYSINVKQENKENEMINQAMENIKKSSKKITINNVLDVSVDTKRSNKNAKSNVKVYKIMKSKNKRDPKSFISNKKPISKIDTENLQKISHIELKQKSLRKSNGKNSKSKTSIKKEVRVEKKDIQSNQKDSGKSHVERIQGPIPGIEVGQMWLTRIEVARDKVHVQQIAGIHGVKGIGAFSVVLSNGYDNIDDGNEIIYSGCGGRSFADLKRNQNNNEIETYNQELEKSNLLLALCCNAPVDGEKGATAKDWKNGKPIRVIRSYKLYPKSKYAPPKGNRYDGIYKVVKYYPERDKNESIVWKFLLRRDDPAPAPWTPEGQKRIMDFGFQAQFDRLYEQKLQIAQKKTRSYTKKLEKVINHAKLNKKVNKSASSINEAIRRNLRSNTVI